MPPSAPSVPGPSSAHTLLLHTYLLPVSTHATIDPKRFVFLFLNLELDLLIYSKGAPTALVILSDFTTTHPTFSSSPLGSQDKDGGLEEDLPLTEAPCALWCGESVTPGWPGGYILLRTGAAIAVFPLLPFLFLFYFFPPSYFVVC